MDSTLIGRILNHPGIKPLVDEERLSASRVRGSTAVDYLVGLVEEGLGQDPSDVELRSLYSALQEVHPQHFKTSRSGGIRLTKNPSYKASKGF